MDRIPKEARPASSFARTRPSNWPQSALNASGPGLSGWAFVAGLPVSPVSGYSRSMSYPQGKREEGGRAVPTYIGLIDWTDQGIRNVRDTLQRADRADQLGEKYGVKMERLYWTVGPHDLVGILEAPDEEAVSAFALELGATGSVRTTMLRAYEREEMSRIVERLGPAPAT